MFCMLVYAMKREIQVYLNIINSKSSFEFCGHSPCFGRQTQNN